MLSEISCLSFYNKTCSSYLTKHILVLASVPFMSFCIYKIFFVCTVLKRKQQLYLYKLHFIIQSTCWSKLKCRCS